ncbi:Tagatose-6-phosphate kinase [Corynebacterium glaucum]|uniref:Tagatose-6-phosphate kinase n=1 Tax=Corynebacterium glaucum TaxID=187491 RepID=A0A1Q2HX54_9CORY|nr:Tagatose-6-phosphate kinase [Corynebacterium glaucum]
MKYGAQMILTLTPNPSIDATLDIGQLERGAVVRATSARREAGGKGINVAHCVHKVGHPTLAIAPCGADDPFELAVRGIGVAFTPVRIDGQVRTNTALTEPDGTTTKVNERGPELAAADLDAIVATLEANARDAQAIVLAGSLPPGAPDDFYVQLVRAARAATGGTIAVDTSDAPLVALGAHLGEGAPDVMKPNAFELAQLTNTDGETLENSALSGDFSGVVGAARELIARGAQELLVTLGGAGACLVTADGAWGATPPPIEVRSTVGAGDSSLAGYVMARVEGLDPAERLRRAVAYGSAAAALPGTGLPAPDALDLDHTEVFPI